MHTSVAPHKSCGCHACQAKMTPIKKIPKIKKWKGEQKFNKKELLGSTINYKWDRLCKHCVAKMPHDISKHKEGIRLSVGHGGLGRILSQEGKLHKGLGL